MGLREEAALEEGVFDLGCDDDEPPDENRDGTVGAFEIEREGGGGGGIEERDGAIAPHHGLEQFKSDLLLSRGGDRH